MRIEILGKFYDNHSLSIINRNLALKLKDKHDVFITPMDSYNPDAKLSKEVVSSLKDLEKKELGTVGPEIQVRHTYPPIWKYPFDKQTKVVFIQPWEYPKVPFEWQYKWETFASALIVPSAWQLEHILNAGLNPEKAFVVPNGYDPEIFNKDTDYTPYNNIVDDKFNFVYVGCSQWRKGIDLLINAWKSAFKKADKVRLIVKDTPQIYGKSNLLSEIIKVQYKTQCAEIVYIDEALSHEQMASIYKASKAVIHPYRAEGFGMHVQEALACGCIPIVPDKGPTNEFIGDTGIKISTQSKPIDITSDSIFALKPGDATTLMSTHTFMDEPVLDDITKKMSILFKHHNKQEIINKARAFTPVNTWDNVVLEYEKVFEKILNDL